MKWFKVLFPLLSGAAVIGLSSGVVASYYGHQENFQVQNEEKETLENEVHLTKEREMLFPGESRSYTIEVDMGEGNVQCSLYFTGITEKAGSLLSVQVSKDDYRSTEQEIGKLKEDSPLTFSSTIKEDHKDFLFTYKVKEDLGGITDLDVSFVCHFEVRKGNANGK